MSEVQIPDLSVATEVNSEDEFILRQSGEDKRTTNEVVIQSHLKKIGEITEDSNVSEWQPNYTVTELEAFTYNGVVYIPIAPMPFNTGAVFDVDQFSVYQLANTNNLLEFKTISDALSYEYLQEDTVCSIKSRNSSKWDVVATGTYTVSPNIYDVYDHDTLPLQIKLRVSSPINIKDFGCTGDYNGSNALTATNNSPILQAIINRLAEHGGGELYAPFGRYYLSDGIDWATGQFKVFKMVGESFIFTTFETENDIVMFTHEGIVLENFAMTQNGGHQNSRALSTPLNTQTLHTTYDKLFVNGFKFGVWWRFSIWNTIKNCVFRDNLCGMKFSRNPLPDDQSNPAAAAPWNTLGGGGFFHNENTFDNNLIIGGEVGVFGTVHTNTFSGLTCQNQIVYDTASNRVLPVGIAGIGVYLQNSGFDASSFGAGGNTINGFYTEVTEQPIITEYVELALGSCFLQGNTFAAPFPQAFKFSGGAIETRGGVQAGGDWFERVIEVSNGALVQGKLTGPAFKTEEYQVLSAAKYFRNRDDGAYSLFLLGIPNGAVRNISGKNLREHDIVDINVSGLVNGSLVVHDRFQLYYRNNVIYRVTTLTGGTGHTTLQITNSVIELVVIGGAGVYDLNSVVTTITDEAPIAII